MSGKEMKQFPWIRVLQIGFLVLLSLFSIFVGVKEISIFDFGVWDTDQIEVLLISRLPRLFSILLTGSGLAISGIIMQAITQNRFVSPTTAGTTEWCRLGVLIAILLFPGKPLAAQILFAVVVSLFGTFLFMRVLARLQFQNAILVPLIGMMMGSVVSAVTTFFAYQYDIVQNMTSWLQGNFSLIIKGNYEILFVSFPFMILAYLYANRFTIAGMGKDVATNLGVNHQMITRVGLMIVAIISSITIVGVGNIPFLGLIIPNIVRLYRGDNVQDSLFDTAWLGSLFVLLCDMLGRAIVFPYEIPIGVMVSVIGSAVFLTLLFRRNRRVTK